MNTRDPNKTLRKSTEVGYPAHDRTESPHGMARYGKAPVQMSKPTSETVFGYANLNQGAQFYTNLSKTGNVRVGERAGRDHVSFKMRKNFTQRVIEDAVRQRPSTASNSSFRNAGTYYTTPSAGKSGAILDAYRKQLPQMIVDPIGQLNKDESGMLDQTGSGTTLLNVGTRDHSNTHSR